MAMGKDEEESEGTAEESESEGEVTVYGRQMEWVQSFRYLGRRIYAKGGDEGEIKARMAVARKGRRT